MTLTALQSSINAPTTAFRGCLKEAATKANSDKVAADAIEEYLRTACSGQMQSLKSAVVAFRMKNGMSRKAAADDADMTTDDYVSAPADNYKFMTTMNSQQPKPAAAPAQPAQPAAATAEPPKKPGQ